MTRPPKAKAIERLRKFLDAIPELKKLRHGSQDFKKWRRDTQVAITYTFGDESRHISDFNNIQFFSLSISFSGNNEEQDQKAYLKVWNLRSRFLNPWSRRSMSIGRMKVRRLYLL